MGFAEELGKRRKMANMTQEELAEKCNVSRQAITKWEKNESLPDVYMISKLANMFDVSIEELIYSRELGILENRNYYVRLLEEKDKADFCNLMREHRYMGKMLKFIDKMGKRFDADEIYWDTYLNQEKTYIIRSKKKEDFIGYLYFEGLEGRAPEMTMQFDKQRMGVDFDFALIRDLLNWINMEYSVRAIMAHINSDVERELFAFLGYENVEHEVMLALPI